jgi:hypothetical protein
MTKSDVTTDLVTRCYSLAEGFYRFRLRNFGAALFAGASRVVIPKIQHRFAEMLHDVGAIKLNVLHQSLTIRAVKNHMFGFAGRTPSFHHQAERVGRPDGRVHNVCWNEERFAFAHEVIDNVLALADAHLDIALQLVEKFLRIDLMKIISRIGPLNDHDEKIATVVKVAIADRWFEKVPVLFDPAEKIDG